MNINLNDQRENASLSDQEIRQIFADSQALLTGHFCLTSGLHSEHYIQCAQVLQYPHYTARLCAELARRFSTGQIDTVIGPAMGGILVAYETARALNVRSIFAERKEGIMQLRRGFKLQPGEKVLVVEDVITTGGSVREVLDIVRSCGAVPIGIGVLADRSGGKVQFDVPHTSLLQMEVTAYQPEVCPLCSAGLPIDKPGSRTAKI